MDELKAWQGSHHDLAMQKANEQTVLGDFNNSSFHSFDVESTFYQKDGQFYVSTDGPDGKMADYRIKYTFGVTPLQQYLIEFPGGRLQALGIAWDSRPQSEGGQRWFHLYPHEKIDHTDPLHWTSRYQNWNLQCAECHSTHLTKGYDATCDRYDTRYAELNVACEACHGPGSQHVEWAQRTKPPYQAHDGKGLIIRLQSRWQSAWNFPDQTAKFAVRDKPADATIMNVCWACHARRSTLTEPVNPGLPLEDSHHPALLTQPTYYADGQQRDEDYTWGSFRQSKMFQKGVTCMDCHDPHTLKLRAEGKALCARCHNPAVFDNQKHHFHKPDGKGTLCMDCHAPEQNYMVIDGRHDHSFRLPRPDLSEKLNTPNACTQCHENQQPAWAAAALDKWYGTSWRDRPHYGTTLHEGDTQGIKAVPALLELAKDTSAPAIVRATAINLLSPSVRPELLANVKGHLNDPDPSIRIAALELLEPLDPINRVLSVSPLLNDPVLGVRIEAARLLADIPENQLPTDKRGLFNSTLKEYLQTLHQNADWPAANVNLGNLYNRQGKLELAIAAYKRALLLDPGFTGAYVALADVYRQQGNEGESELQLRKGLVKRPDAADLHHALGLLLVRKGEKFKATTELERAHQLEPDNARFGYVFGIALHSAGKVKQSLSVLKAVDRRNPYNLDILSAIISISRESHDDKTALTYAKKAAEALPDDANLKNLINELAATYPSSSTQKLPKGNFE